MSKYNKSMKAKLLAIGLLCIGINSYAYITHEVKRSETLWGLSHKYNVSADDIIKANPKVSKGLQTGMILRIPEPADLKKGVDKETTPTKPTKQETKTTTIEPVKVDDTVTTVDVTETAEEIIEPEIEEPQVPDEIFDDKEIRTPSKESKHGTRNKRTTQAVTENTYVAKFGDTMQSVSDKTGVDMRTLLVNNPMISTGTIPEGYIVRLSSDTPYIIDAASLDLVDSIVYRIQPTTTDAPVQDVKTTPKELTVAVMLPFDVENEVISRQSLLATDFYKGFLIAVKQATETGNLPLKVIAIDTQCDSILFTNRLNALASQNVSVIIPPEDEKQLEQIEAFGLDNNIIVLNTLNIKDEGYKKYPNVIQSNISQKLMYEKAINTLMTDFGDYTPVILDLNGGKDEKASFVTELTNRYEDEGRKVINLSFKNKLEDSDINSLPSKGKYIFIPKSGSTEVFNKISEALTTAIEGDVIEERYKVFGYPDWIAYRGEQEETLHRMGANIYSRFYMDTDDINTEDATKEFIRWYGNPMEDVYPSQGILGYDTGKLLFNKLKNKSGDTDIEKFGRGTYSGIQSTFHFVKDEDQPEGLVNDALYIIEYLPGEAFYVRSI